MAKVDCGWLMMIITMVNMELIGIMKVVGCEWLMSTDQLLLILANGLN